MTALSRQLQWLVAIRLVVVTSIVVPYFLLGMLPAPVAEPAAAGPDVAAPAPAAPAPSPVAALGSPTVYRIAGLTYLASFFYLVLLRVLRRRLQLHAYVQFVGDTLLITALVYLTGGITSPFSIFYLVVIAVASTLLGREAGFSVATVAYGEYAALLLCLYLGWIAPHDAALESGDTLFRLLYNLVVNFVAFYLVAVLTSMLAGRAARAERELEAKRRGLADLEVVHRDVIQSITSGLATTDTGGRVTSLNRAGEGILRQREAELIGRPIEEVLRPLPWASLVERPGAPGEPLRSQLELVRDGEAVHLGFSISRLTDAAGTHRGYNVVFQDFTRWRRLEEQVRITDRMAAVGELAAGIAHEIGNPLAAISGSVQMLSRSLSGDPAHQKLLAILLKESQRLDRTIKGFLRFARPRERSVVEFDVAHLLSENFELLRNSDEVAAHHRLELTVEPPSVRMVADPDQVSQIFWNLARNALKAMPEGGRLDVGGEARDGTYRIRFRDTGRGMAEAERANLFHPFHSLFDSGTGIGMAIVYRIVEEHNGKIEVESAEGGGTTIAIDLPLARTPVPAAGEEAPW